VEEILDQKNFSKELFKRTFQKVHKIKHTFFKRTFQKNFSKELFKKFTKLNIPFSKKVIKTKLKHKISKNIKVNLIFFTV